MAHIPLMMGGDGGADLDLITIVKARRMWILMEMLRRELWLKKGLQPTTGRTMTR